MENFRPSSAWLISMDFLTLSEVRRLISDRFVMFCCLNVISSCLIGPRSYYQCSASSTSALRHSLSLCRLATRVSSSVLCFSSSSIATLWWEESFLSSFGADRFRVVFFGVSKPSASRSYLTCLSVPITLSRHSISCSILWYCCSSFSTSSLSRGTGSCVIWPQLSSSSCICLSRRRWFSTFNAVISTNCFCACLLRGSRCAALNSASLNFLHFHCTYLRRFCSPTLTLWSCLRYLSFLRWSARLKTCICAQCWDTSLTCFLYQGCITVSSM